jgi:hypothetical protein
VKILNEKEVAWCYSLFGRNINSYYEAMKFNITIARKNNVKIIIATLCEDVMFIKDYFEFANDTVSIISFKENYAKKYPKLLRYLIPLNYNYDYYFFKDSDSVVTESELGFSDEWINNNDSDCIIIRDHPLHTAPILGGMFGLSSKLAKYSANLLLQNFCDGKVNFEDGYLYDQLWLGKCIYPMVKFNSSIYSSHFSYLGENVIDTYKYWNSNEYIGAQHFENTTNLELKYKKLIRLYSVGKLSVPFYERISSVYQKTRIVLYTAYFIGVFRNIVRCFKLN